MKQKLTHILLISIILSVSTITYFAISHQFRILKVVSNSMAPLINKDDLILVASIQSTSLKVGQIAILPSVDKPITYFAHRIIQIDRKANGELEVLTKGDANPISDDKRIQILSKSAPVYLGVLPISKAPGLAQNSIFLLGGLLLLFLVPLIQASIKRRGYSHAKTNTHQGS